MFTELSLGYWSSGHRNLSIILYQVSSSTVFFFVSYMHIHASLLPSALARGNINRDLFSGYMYVCTYVRSSAQALTSRRLRVGVACAGAGA